MTTKRRLFSRTVSGQVSDLHTKYDYLASIAKREGIDIPDEELDLLAQLLGEVDAAYEKACDRATRSHNDVTNRNEVIRNAIRQFRRTVTYYVTNNDAATDVDREALRIHTSGRHSLLPPPKFVPGIGHISSHSYMITIPFFNAESRKHIKPEGVYGIETLYQVGGLEPTSVTQLTQRIVGTSSPLKLRFDSPDQFKILYLAFRWIGTRGDFGPWSKIYKISISA
jgi:hypothetical protein